ncbi:hypothetical protein [Thalassospira marina]|uniref:Uncharacterized protein n=1 Tax=Thalassospira marina TaxID=2048283 RepID=A0A2N3KY62_9PROT|nr:hypothetical protein [Thalassospira marina]PKR55427.1 hypothetical protein COO20_04450 [Thalassospira marina]
MARDVDGVEIHPGDLVTHIKGEFTATERVKEVGRASVTIDWASTRIPVFASGLVRVVKQ